MNKEDRRCGRGIQWTITRPLKKNDILSFFSNMDGLGGHYAKGNKSEKDKYCMISPICGI